MNKILAFTASWCGPCKAMKPTLETFDPESLIIYDIDDNKELTQSYKISAVPTFIVVDETGLEIDRFMGSQPKSKFESYLA